LSPKIQNKSTRRVCITTKLIPPEMLPQFLEEVEGMNEEFERVETKVLQKEVDKRTVELREANRRYDRSIGAIGDFAKINAIAFGTFLGAGLLPGVAAKAVGTYKGVMSGSALAGGALAYRAATSYFTSASTYCGLNFAY
jgi:hypothetical protein